MDSISVATVGVDTWEAYRKCRSSASCPRTLWRTKASLNEVDDALTLPGTPAKNLASSKVDSNTWSWGVVNSTPVSRGR